MRSMDKSEVGIFLGSQVAAPWQDGIFYPGIVKSVTSRPMGDTLYTVEFDDKYIKNFTDRQIMIGNCFVQNTKDIHLKFNQRVFVTHGDVEMCGYVQKHRKQTNEVFIKLDDSEETLIRKKLEEVRLLSRNNNEFGFPTFDDIFTLNSSCTSADNSKKRTVTDGIEVPCAKTLKVAKEEEEPAMNEVMAAMVLTSLQTASPSFAQCQPMDCTGPPSPPGSASCSSSSDAWSQVSISSPSPSVSSGNFSWDIQSRGTPSPGLSISDAESLSGPMTSPFQYMPHGTPLENMPGALVFSSSVDEGIDMGENSSSVFWDEQSKSPIKLKVSSKTLYKCTWQRCTKTLCTIQGIERHIRTLHLGKKENDFSDHEEEFYYTEVESTMEAFSDTFASMMASSPPPFQQDSNGNAVVTSGNAHNNSETSLNISSQAFFPANMITEQQLKCNSNRSSSHNSLNNTSVFKAIPSTTHQKSCKKFESEEFPRSQFVQEPKLSHVASPPTKAQLQLAGLTCSTKIHAEGRKCRKVYGMENRRLWCTQCKWKKACVRFV
ncbi:zinc finger protein 704-like [Apostichopus japonicus]|uniref:zinc finger protein 704-like n=1 Tax=Stichopus japonicus TaxID=307972 RepID=UPI003AB17975